MAKKIFFDKNYLIIFLFILIIFISICIIYYIQNKCNKCDNTLYDKEIRYNNEINNKIQNIENNLKEANNKIESYQNNKENIVNSVVYPSAVINRDPKELNALDRIYTPTRYPYKSDYFYDQSWYPNLNLPFQVIGGGYRNTPTLGGTQIPIYNPPVPINISNDNIAPINITTRGPLGKPQQMGILYKINGADNDILPLFGRRKYPNDTKYDYYTMIGQFGVKVPIVRKNQNTELGSNDIVFIKGKPSPYRVTIYESDFPQYIPYI